MSEAKLRNIAAEKGYNLIYIEKDYFLTILLYYLKDLDGIYLKGGTALNKIFFNHLRLSEDLDFTVTISNDEVKKRVDEIIEEDKRHFKRLEYEHDSKGFVRIKIFYNGYFTRNSYIVMDVNTNASLHLKSERNLVHNFYNLDFRIRTVNFNELIAEKLRAAITRNQPRDYFDLYFILKKYDVDMELVKKKTEEANQRFDIERIFKNANKIYSKWDEDVGKLTNEKLTFGECIKVLDTKLRK
jgi:predicted nucleotidyltransferase component of viral defense system